MPLEKAVKKTKGKVVIAKKKDTPPKGKSSDGSVLGEIKPFNRKYHYTVFLTSNRSPGPGRDPQPIQVQGDIREVSDDWIRIRTESGYKEYRDMLIPLASILYFVEHYQGES